MARPKRQVDTPETRDEILRAARIEFAAQGIAAPLDAIASRCGIKRPSLLHHFPSKQALIAAVTDDILQKARVRLLKTIAEKGTDQAATMQQIFNVLRELEMEEQGVGGVLLHAMLAESSDGPVTRRVAEFVDIIYATAVLASGEKSEDPEEFRAALAHLVMGEMTKVALGQGAMSVWGTGDGLNSLFSHYLMEGYPLKGGS